MTSDIPPRRIRRDELFATLPPVHPEDYRSRIRDAFNDWGGALLVLDDDPTGTQTVHDVPVLTMEAETGPNGDLEAELCRALGEGFPCIYILTNSRSLPAGEARSLSAGIGRVIRRASERTKRPARAVSRSDSTLRGHFPEETDALAAGLGTAFDGLLLAPAFFDDGRMTVGDTHYVLRGDDLVPAAETGFARDPAFGYHESNLRRWVEEKTRGRVRADSVRSISIEEIRVGGHDTVAERLRSLRDGAVCVVNAAVRRDFDVVAMALSTVEAKGSRFLYRTAASFVPARLGMRPRPPLLSEELNLPDGPGGLVVVGSHVTRTTGQLKRLLSDGDVVGVAVPVERLLDPARRDRVIEQAAATVDRRLLAGTDVALFTDRSPVVGADPSESLAIARSVSEGLVEIVRSLTVWPRYLLAKGGITSSDLATMALGVRRATVRGQLLPDVPVWELGGESRFPGLTYVVFPGNVGDEGTLREAVRLLAASPRS